LLLDTGEVEADLKDFNDRTPLTWAAINGHEAVVQLLLNTSNVDFNSQDIFDETPLSYATHIGHEAVIKLLKKVSFHYFMYFELCALS
jgi:ankyrin repeat protein